MKKTINNILNGFCATMQDPDFEAFVQQIRDDLTSNPELTIQQQKFLTSWINTNPEVEDLTLELAAEIARWINNLPKNQEYVVSQVA